MTIWDVLTWASIGVLGPGVLVICVAVARDLRRLLGRPAPVAGEGAAPSPDDRRG
jgi:hypothetical protein